MRFAMVTTFYPPYSFGGDGRYVRRLSHALARRGHEIHVIHDADAYRHLSGGRDLPPLEEPEGVHVHRLHSAIPALASLATHQLGYPLVHAGTIRRILGQGFDVIHFHNVSLVGGPGLLAFGTGIKIYTAHEHWLVCPTHVLWRHQRELCTERQCWRCTLNYRRPPQMWRSNGVVKRAIGHVDAFLALSRFSAELHAAFGFPVPMTVIPPFLPEAVPPAATHPVPRRPYFLFVGRLEKIKGLHDVIPLFGAARPADLLIAGTDSDERSLRDLAANFPSVQFLGPQSDAQLTALYRGALALIAPSICYEVFPLVVLEAFRQGLPVIARRLGPYPEILEASGAGLLFSDRRELDDALRLMATEPARRQSFASAAASAFHRLWREDVVVPRYLDMLRAVAQRRGLADIERALTDA